MSRVWWSDLKSNRSFTLRFSGQAELFRFMLHFCYCVWMENTRQFNRSSGVLHLMCINSIYWYLSYKYVSIRKKTFTSDWLQLNDCVLSMHHHKVRGGFVLVSELTFTLSPLGIGCLNILLLFTITWFKQWSEIPYAGWTFESWKRKWSGFENCFLLYVPVYLVKQRSKQWNSSVLLLCCLQTKNMWTNPLWKVHFNNFKSMRWRNWLRNFSMSWVVRIRDDFHIKCRYQVSGVLLC